MASPHDKPTSEQERKDDNITQRDIEADRQTSSIFDRDANEEVDDDATDRPHVATFYQTSETDLNKFFLEQVEADEGCVMDLTNEGQGAGTYPWPFPMTEDTLPPPARKQGGFVNDCLPDDSGFSSRMSEDSTSLHRAVEIADLKKAVAVVADDDKDNGKGDCGPKAWLKGLIKLLGVVFLLYLFICSLDLLSNAFRLLGGKTAGSVFRDSKLLQNPITGLMIGVLATVILQSSSTSSSIVITMVSSGILDVRPAIPIVMGANIGTTVTNTLVSLAHSMDPREFRRAFSGATVHDVFNWLTVLILLPLEHFTGYLYHLTLHIVDSLDMESIRTKKQDLLKQLTKPLTKRIVQVDKKVISKIAEGKADPEARLLKIFCTFNKTETMVEVNKTMEDGNITLVNETIVYKTPVDECESLLSALGWSDMTSGILLLVFSLILLSSCLYFMVKVLHSLLGSHVARVAKKTINANFPGPFACLTDYVALIVGAGMTILVQSSSVFTSALTPLVGVGCLKLERMYPLTLGSNIGTTATGILAALASSAVTMKFALQLALCHLFFNITGIMLFFPVPVMRRFPLRVARFLGRTTAKYRWFAVFYLMMMFLVFPGVFLTLSFAGDIVFITVLSLVGTIIVLVIVINVFQQRPSLRGCLPAVLQTWEWLPLWMRSLQPLDSLFRAACSPLKRLCCNCCLEKCRCLAEGAREDNLDSLEEDSDDDDDDDDSGVGSDDAVFSCLCCCRPHSGVLQVSQSEKATDLMESQSNGHHPSSVWYKRTSRPIYKPSAKAAMHHTPSTVPLISIPESVV